MSNKEDKENQNFVFKTHYQQTLTVVSRSSITNADTQKTLSHKLAKSKAADPLVKNQL